MHLVVLTLALALALNGETGNWKIVIVRGVPEPLMATYSRITRNNVDSSIFCAVLYMEIIIIIIIIYGAIYFFVVQGLPR
jgi:hypothetical protein